MLIMAARIKYNKNTLIMTGIKVGRPKNKCNITNIIYNINNMYDIHLNISISIAV